MKKRTAAILIAAMALTSVMGGPGLVAGAEASDEEPTEITFWHSMESVYGEILQKQVDTFNETIGSEENIHVTAVFQDWPGTEALTAAKSTDDVDNMPDVIQMYSEYVSLISDWDRTVWVEDLFDQGDSDLKKEDLVDNMVSSYSINDRMIGMPYSASALLLYYNLDLLQEAGYEEPPKTIAEMADMCAAIAENTDADYGLNVRINQYEFENFIASQGAEGTWFGNNDSGRSGDMTELACLDQIDSFLTEWEKVIQSGGYKATKDSMNEEFAAGLNAMAIMSSTKIPTIRDLVGDAFTWGVAAVPTVSSDDIGGSSTAGSALFMIDREDDAKQQAAWKFVQYMASPEAQVMWLDGSYYVPVNKNTVNLDAWKDAVAEDERLQVPMDILMNEPASVVASFCPNSSEVDTVIRDAMLNFADGTSKEDTYNTIVDGIADAFETYFRANSAE